MDDVLWMDSWMSKDDIWTGEIGAVFHRDGGDRAASAGSLDDQLWMNTQVQRLIWMIYK